VSGPPKTPLLAVDCVVFDRSGRLLLVRRGRPPFKGSHALPGGFVEIGETVEEAALRELKEETGIEGRITDLVGVYSNPKRDPRRHTASVVFRVRPNTTKIVHGDDAASAVWVENWRELKLAFDHGAIVADASRRKR
jgi:8-oxo-dGTP diphosphatase